MSTGARIAQLVQRLAIGWTVWGSNPGVGEIFRTRPDCPWGPPSLLYNGYRLFSGGNTTGAWRWPPTPSSAEVKERLERYRYSPFGTWWPVIEWTLLYRVCHTKNILGLHYKHHSFNLLTPNVNYSGRTAPLTSKVAFYIFIQQI